MPDPITFTSASARLGLPFLFTAQAQKEFTVNEALARLDALLHLAVEGTADAPPAAPVDGEAWLVGDTPTDEWTGHAGEIACRQAGNWLFQPPLAGMRVYDKSAGQQALFDDGWSRASDIALPSGGATQDSEARTAIAGLVAALVATGILA
ncbi:DUF2793 domain-containing protein [Aurantiacibacter suaedae]|uniref:DUF2793 domain-containing protein n=1 Tax=Aurantiacibacter suaedae TaxID=2545755 RepID=UPI0010F6A28F|nr:DUF2793 domain-containing protein [Aurantiacibacter suaedae]